MKRAVLVKYSKGFAAVWQQRRFHHFALGYIVIAGRRGPLGRRLGGEREPSTTAVDRRYKLITEERRSLQTEFCAPASLPTTSCRVFPDHLITWGSRPLEVPPLCK